ncbi:MAG: hypothetical protein K2P46_05045, partial [Alistipes sp.]|nr:hypothetical protein [Alistipes sp.]
MIMIVLLIFPFLYKCRDFSADGQQIVREITTRQADRAKRRHPCGGAWKEESFAGEKKILRCARNANRPLAKKARCHAAPGGMQPET